MSLKSLKIADFQVIKLKNNKHFISHLLPKFDHYNVHICACEYESKIRNFKILYREKCPSYGRMSPIWVTIPHLKDCAQPVV